MEALVNIAYDRISEDIILLYDAMRAYNEVCMNMALRVSPTKRDTVWPFVLDVPTDARLKTSCAATCACAVRHPID